MLLYTDNANEKLINSPHLSVVAEGDMIHDIGCDML